MQAPVLTRSGTALEMRLSAAGAWTAAHADIADALASSVPCAGVPPRVDLDLGGVTALDTFGAWVLERLVRSLSAAGAEARIIDLPSRFQALVGEVHTLNRSASPAPPSTYGFVAVWRRGRDVGSNVADGAMTFLAMLGLIGAAVGRLATRPGNFRLTSSIHHLDRVGWQAIGIILLITFLIGGIIAQQGIFHFRTFGADDYVVDLVGILVLREIGVLIVAIMVAGRSGSSYTAEIGSMKMREEIDALRTMGLDPVEILILPRVVALLIALPLLAFLGSMSALFGGGVVSWLYGGMSPEVYLARLQEAVTPTHFAVGMIKAPFMALVIGVVAAAEGLRVKGSAESLGLQTTTSVVKSIFLVIVLDGLFAIFFASVGM